MTQILLCKWRQMDWWVIDICLSSFGQIFNTLTCILPQEGNPTYSFWFGLLRLLIWSSWNKATLYFYVFWTYGQFYKCNFWLFRTRSSSLELDIYFYINQFQFLILFSPIQICSKEQSKRLEQKAKLRISLMLVFNRKLIQPKGRLFQTQNIWLCLNKSLVHLLIFHAYPLFMACSYYFAFCIVLCHEVISDFY